MSGSAHIIITAPLSPSVQASSDINTLSSQDDRDRAIESLRASTSNCPRYSSDDQFTSPRGRWIKDDWLAYYAEVITRSFSKSSIPEFDAKSH